MEYLCRKQCIVNKRISEHNREVRNQAEYRAQEMKHFPSPLEERMQFFLEKHWILYEPQKIFYIYAEDGWIIRYYIADFYLPGSNVIIEVDGKFHDKQKQHDKHRTKTIQEHYPGVEVIRFTMKDLSDEEKLQELLTKIK